MNGGTLLVWIAIGFVIIIVIIAGVIIYSTMQEGMELSKSGDMTGWTSWFAGFIIIALVIVGIIVIFTKKS